MTTTPRARYEDMTALDYVDCSCGKRVSLLKSGKLRQHTVPRVGHEQFPPLCKRSGSLPA